MTRATTIARLLTLRRAKEQRALEMLMQRDRDYHLAEKQVEDAKDAIARHMTRARARERRKIQSLIGRTVSPTAMARLQSDLDVLMAEATRLREIERHAQAALDHTRQARDAARDQFRLCQRATTKLEQLAEQDGRKAARRRAALAEATVEERPRSNSDFASPEPHSA